MCIVATEQAVFFRGGCLEVQFVLLHLRDNDTCRRHAVNALRRAALLVCRLEDRTREQWPRSRTRTRRPSRESHTPAWSAQTSQLTSDQHLPPGALGCEQDGGAALSKMIQCIYALAPETAIHARGHPRATVPDEPPLQWSSSRDVSVLGRALIYVPAAAAHLLLLAVAGRAEVLAALLAAPLEHRTPRRRGHARAEARGVRALALRATLGAAQREAAGDHHQRAASALHGGHRARRQRQAYRGGWR